MSRNPDIVVFCIVDTAPPRATNNPARLGRSLQDLRRRRRLSQAQLAESLGVQRSYLSQLENGEFSEQVKRILDILNALDADLIVMDRATPRPVTGAP